MGLHYCYHCAMICLLEDSGLKYACSVIAAFGKVFLCTTLRTTFLGNGEKAAGAELVCMYSYAKQYDSEHILMLVFICELSTSMV